MKSVSMKIAMFILINIYAAYSKPLSFNETITVDSSSSVNAHQADEPYYTNSKSKIEENGMPLSNNTIRESSSLIPKMQGNKEKSIISKNKVRSCCYKCRKGQRKCIY